MKIFVLFCVIFLVSCSLAPHYQRPLIPTPSSYKETGKWLFAKPQAADRYREAWWEVYRDSLLNDLENRATISNQNLKAALARYDQARAELAVARSAYFPTLTGVMNANRQKISTTATNAITKPLFDDFLVGANFNYELDVWGKIRNSVAVARSTALASAADLAVINLTMHAELAYNYFSLRGADEAQRILDETVSAYKIALYLTRKRYQGGAASVLDVDEAVNQLETAKTLAEDMHLKRAQLEHAIAVLLGEPPATFSIKPYRYQFKFVNILPSLPSTLLERRPDIAEAELLVQAANSNIGVARAAFFPDFNISGGIGFESAILSNLFKAPSLIWSLGPAISSASVFNTDNKPIASQIIFDGGRIRGLSAQACAKYFETVANYRQTVLNAYKEVEDSLVAIRQLNRERQTQSIATAAAERALTQAMFRYKGGLTTYLDVVVVQNLALQAELSNFDIMTRRQLASVQLIKALGGGWTSPPIKCG